MALLVILGGLLLYLPFAGSYGLWDPWETHYSEVARQMTHRGDFISLWWPGSPRDVDVFWSKPVLSFWLMSIGMHLAGIGSPGPLDTNAGVILWLQGNIVYVMSRTRFRTSQGADADSWGADYGFGRLGATPATGAVTFTRFTTTTPSTVFVGTKLQTGDGTQTFQVTTDASNRFLVRLPMVTVI